MDVDKQFEKYGEDTPEFSLVGTEMYARLIALHDGDTCKLILPVGGNYYKFAVRMNGLDTPEMTSKDPRAKALARKARDRHFELATGQALAPSTNDAVESAKKKSIKSYLESNIAVVWVKCGELDRYGRPLVDIRKTKDGRTFTEILLEEKLAYEYGGKTKLGEAEQVAALDG